MAIGVVLIGRGNGPITPARSHLVARSTRAHRMSCVFAVKQTGEPLGGGLAGMIGPGLACLIGWQGAVLIIATITLLCAVAIQPLCAELDADKDNTQALSFGSGLAAPLRLVFSHRSLAVLAGVSFLLSMTQLSLTTYLVTYLHDDLSMGLIIAGFTLAVAQAAGVAGRLAWGYLSDRYLGPINMLALLAVLIVACSVITPFLVQVNSQALTLIVLSLFGASAVGWNGVYLAEVARQAPKGQASIATGGTLCVTFLGIVIGPPIFGLIAKIGRAHV